MRAKESGFRRGDIGQVTHKKSLCLCGGREFECEGHNMQLTKTAHAHTRTTYITTYRSTVAGCVICAQTFESHVGRRDTCRGSFSSAAFAMGSRPYQVIPLMVATISGEQE
jgi:hypothetical protein